jgi:hypothetical protein
MADSETVRGTIGFVVRREGQQPIVLELELRVANGRDRLVRVAEEMGRGLREGQEIEATGTIDANQVLVADTIHPVVAPRPTPPSSTPWLLLATPAIAGATILATALAIQNSPLPRFLWMIMAIVAIGVGQRKNTGHRARILLRTIGGAVFITALILSDRTDGGGVILLLLLMALLSVGAAFAAIILFFMRRASGRPPAPGA